MKKFDPEYPESSKLSHRMEVAMMLQAMCFIAGGDISDEKILSMPFGELLDLIYPNGITLKPLMFKEMANDYLASED